RLAGVRGDLRDWALQGMAAKLRQCAEVGDRAADAVGRLFGTDRVWAPAVVSDAGHAWRALARSVPAAYRGEKLARSVVAVPVGAGIVKAVCSAPHTGELFLGCFHSGVVCFRPQTGEVVPLAADPRKPHTVLPRALAVDADGRLVFLL